MPNEAVHQLLLYESHLERLNEVAPIVGCWLIIGRPVDPHLIRTFISFALAKVTISTRLLASVKYL